LKRVAFGVRDVAAPAPKAASVAAASHTSDTRGQIESVVDQWLGRRNPTPAMPVAPPLSSYTELQPAKPIAEKKETKPVGFVCEDDVRAAIQANSKIVVGKKTIITPSARELAEASDVFVIAEP